VLRAVLSLEAHIAYNLAKFDLGAEVSRQGSELFEAAGDAWGRLDTAWVPVYAAAFAGRREEAVDMARQLLPLAERVGHRPCSWVLQFPLIENSVADGDLEKAHRMARETADFGQISQIGWSFIAEVVLANIARLLGRTAEATQCCRSIMGRGLPKTSFTGHPLATLALTMAQAGDPGASAALRDAVAFLPRPGMPAPLGSWQALPLVIEGFATIDATKEAAALLPAAEELVNIATAFTDVALMPRTAAGIAAACAGDWERATEHHLTALEQTQQHRPGNAIARYWYAEMLLARGAPADRARARELLREVQGAFESLSMPLYACRAGERAKI